MSDQTTAPVLLDVDDGVARLRLNRPEASNALDLPLLKALLDAIMRCHGDPGVRALLLSGEGANFCAGGDVRDFAAQGERILRPGHPAPARGVIFPGRHEQLRASGLASA